MTTNTDGAMPELPEPDGYAAISGGGTIIVPPRDFAKHNGYAIFTADQMREYARAAIQQAAGAVPEGCRIVPMEPSEAMLDRAVAFALNVSLGGSYGWTDYMRDLYARMLSAVPSKAGSSVHLGGGEGGWVPQWQPIEGCVEAMAATRYHVDKTESGFWPYVVRCGTGTQVLHKGHLTSCQRFAQQMTMAFLDGAFVAVNGNKAQSALDATIDQRNRAQRFADEMAAQIAAITGSDIGEHSSSNCPWQQAILAADDFLASQPGHTVEGAMAEQLSGPPVTLETLPVCNCPATGKADPSIHAPNCPARLALTRPKAS